MECVFGTDEQRVYITDLTQPFTSRGAPSLAGKPKLFFREVDTREDPCRIPPHRHRRRRSDRAAWKKTLVL
ncbi:uncharacterized protein ACO6RY_14323 [Pungitius sinensis]